MSYPAQVEGLVNIWKKIMDSNLTICKEKLTTSNPNRKGGFIEKQSQSTLLHFGSAEPSSGLWGVLLVMLSVDGCIKNIYIYIITNKMKYINNMKQNMGWINWFDLSFWISMVILLFRRSSGWYILPGFSKTKGNMSLIFTERTYLV